MRLVLCLLGATGLLLVYRGVTAESTSRARPWRATARRYLHETGWPWLDERVFVAAVAASGAAGTMAVLAMSGDPILAVGAGGAAASLPPGRVRARRAKLRMERAAAWPDALAALISGVRSGISLPECCIGLGVRGPEALKPAFERFAGSYRSSGSFEAALARLRGELADPVADRVAVVLSLAHQVGGSDLVRILRVTSDAVREELRIANEVRARWSWTVTAARFAAAAPYAVVLMMSLRSEAVGAYSTPAGTATLVGGSAAIVLGYRLMLRVARLPEEKRLLG